MGSSQRPTFRSLYIRQENITDADNCEPAEHTADRQRQTYSGMIADKRQTNVWNAEPRAIYTTLKANL